MAITVINAVIHGFDKEQREEVLTNIFRRQTVLDVTKNPVIELVRAVAGLLGKRDNSLAWGRFRTDSRRGLFPSSFKSAVKTQPDLQQAGVFYALSLVAFQEILDKAKVSNFATGSKVLFAYYSDEADKKHLLIAMIKQKGGIQLNKDYEPIDVETIDMTKLSHAAEIKCSEFVSICQAEAANAALDEPDEDFEEQAYLSFMSNRDADGAAAYFIDALGCDVHRSSKKSTSLILRATQEIFKKNPELKEYAKEAKEAVRHYLQDRVENNLPAKLEEIHAVVYQLVPFDLVNHLDNFVSTINGGEYKIPSEFSVSADTLEKLSKVTLKDNGIEIKFNKDYLGTDDDSKIKYDKRDKSIRVKLTDKQIAALEKQLAENV